MGVIVLGCLGKGLFGRNPNLAEDDGPFLYWTFFTANIGTQSKKPDTGWEPVIVSEDQLLEECLYRIGNMCLLGEANKKLGGKIFNEKKKVYAQSDLILTKDVAKYGVWNRNSIDDRQESLAKLAVARWRFQ